MTKHSRSARLTRREALNLLGAGAGLGLVAAARGKAGLAAAAKVSFPKGAIIRTVLKDVPPEALAGGATLFHEHVSIYDPSPSWLPPRKDGPPFSANLDLMVDEVRATARDGVSCIVNGGTKDLGQNVEHLKTISTRSGMHIVAAGGLWTQPAYPPDIAQKTADQIADDFLRDASAERWGALGEIGTSLTMHPDEVKVLHAVSKVHLRTGLPIFTHTPHQGCRQCALDQLDILESQGVNPRILCIGHLSDITDDPRAETHKAIAKRGAFLGFDTVGHQITQPDSKKVGTDPGAARGRVRGSHSSIRRFRQGGGAQGQRRRRILVGCDGVRSEAAVRGREGSDDSQDPGRQPAPVSRLRAEERVIRASAGAKQLALRSIQAALRRQFLPHLVSTAPDHRHDVIIPQGIDDECRRKSILIVEERVELGCG